MARKTSGLEKINAAAVRVIGQKGFARATTQEIARAAGVSEALIFRYYKTKLDLGLALFRRHYREVLATLTAVGAAEPDPLERIRRVAGAFYEWFDQNRAAAGFLIKTYPEFLERAAEEQGFIFLASSALKDMLGEEAFLLLPVDILSAMLVGAFLQVSVECLHGQVRGPLAPRMAPVTAALIGLARKATGGDGHGAHGTPGRRRGPGRKQPSRPARGSRHAGTVA